MKTQNSKQAIIKFKTKYSYYYIEEKCERCIKNEDFREQLGFSFINYDYMSSGLREVIITFDLEDVEHFKTEFRKSKIFKDMISMRFKNNAPNYDEVFEYHMPCLSVDMLGRPHKHERYDCEINFIHKRIKYVVHYCNWCYEHQSYLSYEYGHLTRLLHFIVEECGLFKEQEGKLYWHKGSDSYDNPSKEAKLNYDYELIYSDSFNKYYIKTPKTILELV